MDKKTLESYGRIKLEIEALEKKIRTLREEPPQSHSDMVRGSNPDFPYQPQSFRIEGYSILQEADQRGRVEQLVEKLSAKKAKLDQLEDEIEDFIDSIDDITLRLIFRYRYLDQMTYEEIGRKIHIDRSRISRRIDSFLKNAHKTQN